MANCRYRSSARRIVPLSLTSSSSPPRSATNATRASQMWRHPRSEEHTSELQSLMRISYAVLCLKKKNDIYTSKTLQHTDFSNTTHTRITFLYTLTTTQYI